MSTFKPSKQQARFYRFLQAGEGSAILEAVAGSGKTTTLIQGLAKMEGSIFFGAYNKKIADEIRSKAEAAGLSRPGIHIATMHSAGFNAFRRAYPKVQLDENKVKKIIQDDMGKDNPLFITYASFIQRMVSFGKAALIGEPTGVSNLLPWMALCNHFSAGDDLPDDAKPYHVIANYVIPVFERSRKLCHSVIDYDDMIYAPITYNCRMFQNDWVLIDECQDINVARRELAARMLRPGGRLIAVGDPRQAIYGFTGAGADSIEQIAKEFSCSRFPLSVTYRCPKKVVEYVHQWVDHIQAHPDAKDGEVVTYAPSPVVCAKCGGTQQTQEMICWSCSATGEVADSRAWYLQRRPSATSAILCRYTRPLIETAYGMLREGIGCKVEGREIGRGLAKLATRWKGNDLEKLEENLTSYLARELEKAGDNETRQTTVEDVVGTLRVFIDRTRSLGKHTITDLVAEIEALFSDNVTGVCTLSTGHKAKGREWKDVYWLQAALRIRRPLQDWEATQETNLNYVIGTRAMGRLILIPEPFHTSARKEK